MPPARVWVSPELPPEARAGAAAAVRDWAAVLSSVQRVSQTDARAEATHEILPGDEAWIPTGSGAVPALEYAIGPIVYLNTRACTFAGPRCSFKGLALHGLGHALVGLPDLPETVLMTQAHRAGADFIDRHTAEAAARRFGVAPVCVGHVASWRVW